MTNKIELAHWLQVIDTEYLASYIPEGGSSVKVAVASDHLVPALNTGLDDLCRERDCLVLRLDAKAMRANMPQDFFFSLARQLDWRTLARRFILELASRKGHDATGVSPETAGIYETIAEANDVSSLMVRAELRPEIEREVFRDPNMAKDFRVCMSQLCWKEFDRHEYTGQPLLDWLTGENTRIGPVRPFEISGGIKRTTARYFIESSLHWIQKSGHSGTVVLFDNRRVTLSRNPKDGHRYYTRAITLEHYEMLREFIDSADRLSNTLMIILTSNEFLDASPESRSRGYGIYPALQTRVMDDVRDPHRANPVASLVVLS
ncbi:MAG: DUF2791 family P-loop domain-containing protein [bacterium]|nr:DUF2791 family P-loop domain-containing protein [bacterium]